jgi:TolB-like protein
MSSVVTGFEYDIFISYRHNDNRSGWVTDFVNALQEELAATIKKPLSIYFDKNPHDGLLETHSVDKSLEGKLKCLILIPIISQTYCDPKSFAWEHEFCAFNKLAKEDQFGRDIKLSNGNVASRILPIKIHDLDEVDKSIIENEMGSVLRTIEFIYKSPGVNRPLTPTDKREENSNKTFYRDQLNKAANSIKELLHGISQPKPIAHDPQKRKFEEWRSMGTNHARNKKFKWLAVAVIVMVLAGGYYYFSLSGASSIFQTRNKSIAVLSFADMSPNKDQEYLGDGIAEEILNSLAKINGLKVIGRTSSFSFKGKDASLKTIGETLGANTILEGSIQKSGNKIRVTAQLINAADETHIWSERYDSEEKDIFSIQDDIVSRIVEKLKGSLTPNEAKTKIPTINLQAYEMFLRARYFREKGITGQQQALLYYQQAIDLEPTFAQAYAEISATYWNMGVFGLMSQEESLIKAKEAALKAISLDNQSYYAYNQLGYLQLTGEWDTRAYQENYEKAVALGLPLPDPWHGYYEQWFLGITDNAVKEAKILVDNDPLSVELLVHLSRVSLGDRQYEEVIKTGIRALELSPDHSSIFRHTGEAYLFTGRPQLALPYFEKLMKANPYYAPQGFVAVQMKLGNREVAIKTFNEVRDSIPPGKKAICYIYLGMIDSAFVAIEDGTRQRDIHLAGMGIEEHFDILRSDPRYPPLLKKISAPK